MTTSTTGGTPRTTAAAQPDTRPLANVRVLDIASFMAAPMAAMWLADFGAQVVKVEHPRGDMMRSWGSVKDGTPLFWKMVGRNKRSVTIDLHHPDGQELLRRMAAKADVVVENFRPGTLAGWGLDYERLSAINPRLVMLSVSGFGQTGPYSPRAGFGTLAEAMSGYAFSTGDPDGPPTLPSFGLADSVTGLCGAYAVLLALHERDTVSNRGQSIDLAIYEPMMVMMGHQFVEYDQLGIVAQRLGSRLPFAAPRNVFLTRDKRWVAMSCSAQSVFERACSAIGHPELVHDARFTDNRARTENYKALDDIFGEWIAARPAEEVLTTLNDAGGAAAPIYDVADVFADPHFQFRENLASVADEDLGVVRMQNVAPKLSRTPGRIDWTGPALGAHTAEVLDEWIGMGEDEVSTLRAQGVI
ncbi:MAG TPA: CoA transferase [Candidatus Dormibacteraeota bacterium]|nr:CoA transferase [Candidatus Dormibacteraeota bacterium]